MHPARRATAATANSSRLPACLDGRDEGRSSRPTRASSPRTPTAKPTSTSATSRRGPRRWSPPSGACPTGLDCRPTFGGASGDGSHVFFETNDSLAGADTDEYSDVYDWSGGTPSAGLDRVRAAATENSTRSTRAAPPTARPSTSRPANSSTPPTPTAPRTSTRASGGRRAWSRPVPRAATRPFAAEFRWASPDDSTDAVIFTTAEALTAGDTDEAQDIYIRSGGTTTLLSTGPDGGNGAGRRALREGIERRLAGLLHHHRIAGRRRHRLERRRLRTLGEHDDPGLDRDGRRQRPVRRRAERGLGRRVEGLLQHARAPHLRRRLRRRGGRLLALQRRDTARLGAQRSRPRTRAPGSDPDQDRARLAGRIDRTQGRSARPPAGTTVKIYTNSECSEAPVATGTLDRARLAGHRGHRRPRIDDQLLGDGGSAKGSSLPAPRAASPTPRKNGSAATAAPPPPPRHRRRRPTKKNRQEKGTGTGRQKRRQRRRENGRLQRRDHLRRRPRRRVTFGPSFKTRKRRPVFRFIDATGQPGTTFLCRVDKRRWKPCASPLKLPRLGRGPPRPQDQGHERARGLGAHGRASTASRWSAGEAAAEPGSTAAPAARRA